MDSKNDLKKNIFCQKTIRKKEGTMIEIYHSVDVANTYFYERITLTLICGRRVQNSNDDKTFR